MGTRSVPTPGGASGGEGRGPSWDGPGVRLDEQDDARLVPALDELWAACTTVERSTARGPVPASGPGVGDQGQAADLVGIPRRRTRRARDQQRRPATVTTDLGVPEEPATSVATDLTGRWNILDRGVRPLVVRSDGTFTLFDHRDGRTDGRWLKVSDTFVSLFVDGPKRHSMQTMPDGRVFLSRHAPPGSASTPELMFRSVLSFEGTWETPYRASQHTPAPHTRMTLGADRTFCADLGHRGGDDGSVLVWSGIWARTSDRTATLDYVAWVVADGVRRMASHGQSRLELSEDGTMTVAALDDVFYPVPGTVRAEGDVPLAAADEPDVLLCPLAVDDPPVADESGPDATSGPAEHAREVETPPVEGPAAPDVEGAPRPVGLHRDVVGTVELPPVEQVDVVVQGPASRRDAVTAELLLVTEPSLLGNDMVVPVAG